MNNYIYTPYVSPASELYHHGIKGQKWGIRKYQNEDGSLTAAGRKRYGVGERITNAFRNIRKASEGKGYSATEVEKNYDRRAKLAASDYKLARQAAKQQLREDKRELGSQAAKENYRENIRKARDKYNDDQTKASLKLGKEYGDVRTSSIVGDGLRWAAAGFITTAAGKALTANGKLYAGAVLEGAGAGMMLGGSYNAVVRMGAKYASRLMYKN